ncbi:UvrD-helicase domain-containing protein [Lentisphaerota bacterium WC36G]|nr:UvrD-helicase domain-containing protein [Lentisphaerae bacterium WC36]
MDLDYQSFVTGDKKLLIAPAGYGKTHTIVECLNHTKGKQLILTHTHAGVSAIKAKIRKEKISNNKFHLETISSFAQKYVHAFYTGNEMPNQDDNKNYFPFIIKEAMELFKLGLVKNTIKLSYDGLFVDEYQDCNKDQHEMIMALSKILPLRVLGDPLQGIFEFNGGELVDFEEDLNEFDKYKLETPHRWHNYQKHELAEALKTMRESLGNRETINLQDYNNVKGIEIYSVNDGTFLKWTYVEKKQAIDLINENESLLVLTANDFKFSNINSRKKLKSQINFDKSLNLIEAIDQKDLYATSKKIDEVIGSYDFVKFKNDILCKIFNKSEVNSWFNNTGVKNKRNEKEKSEKLKKSLDKFIGNPSPKSMLDIIKIVKDKLKCKYGREELLRGIIKALEISSSENISVYEGMKKHRNIIRRVVRKVEGKYLGTTLLTKGLEFDTVVILNAEKFDCPKHLYVALTRCCKKLIIFTENMTLSPYKK